MKKIVAPKYILIEQTALEFAANFYEIGRGQGLKSKHKNARDYAKHNLERFIPLAVKHLIECLSSPNLPEQAKRDIFEALAERHNDEELNKVMPNNDVEKAIAAVDLKEKQNRKVIEIIDKAIKQPVKKPSALGKGIRT